MRSARPLAGPLGLAFLLSVCPVPAEAFPVLREPAQCLALAMYWEAKGEGREGMLAVGHVVLNRVEHPQFPDEVCEVVTEGGETPPCQFSWWCDGRSDRPVEERAWRDALSAARHVLKERPPDRTRGALFFHNPQLGPAWKDDPVRTARIGRHVFYR